MRFLQFHLHSSAAAKPGRFRNSSSRTAPAVTGINIDPPIDQELHNLEVAFAGCNVQSSPPIQVNAIYINAIVQQILDSLHVTSTGHALRICVTDADHGPDSPNLCVS
ncbi:hypothetical protein CsSME_00021249 [Camellia sinensis var. sinensis]